MKLNKKFMLFSKVNHVAIIASDLEVSKEFYVGKLGFKMIHRVDRPERQSSILYLNGGNIILELMSFPDPPKRLEWPEATGLRHLAFDVEDFDAIIKKLNETGIETEDIRIDARTGKRLTFFLDPDRLPLEICEI